MVKNPLSCRFGRAVYYGDLNYFPITNFNDNTICIQSSAQHYAHCKNNTEGVPCFRDHLCRDLIGPSQDAMTCCGSDGGFSYENAAGDCVNCMNCELQIIEQYSV